MKKLLPLLLALLGLGAGVGAGLALKPADPPAAAAAHGETQAGSEATAETSGHGAEAAAETAAEDQAPAAAGHETAAGGHGAGTGAEPGAEASHGGEAATEEYVKLSNQFVVPVVAGGRVKALVVLSVSLQVGAGSREAVFAREPKLRDTILQVLFDHANAGGFDGVFTSAENLRTLRTALREAAQSVMGDTVSDILITDMMRQES